MKYSIYKIYKNVTNRMINLQFSRKNKILPYVDINRNKFLFKIGNAWIIYLDNKQVLIPNIYKIKKILENYLEIFKLNTVQFNLQNRTYIIEFINDLKNNNMIIKSFKESGKYLVYKQKYDIPRLYKSI